MIDLSRLPKMTTRKKKRVGRGYGSGKGGHTVGRGAKGLKARGKVPLTFAGTKIKKSFLKRLPFRRGKGKFKSFRKGPLGINLKYLNLLPDSETVDLACLVKHRIVGEKEAKSLGVKILGGGELGKALKVALPCSKGAAEKIEKAGGKVIGEKKAAYKPPKTKSKESQEKKTKIKNLKRKKEK